MQCNKLKKACLLFENMKKSSKSVFQSISVINSRVPLLNCHMRTSKLPPTTPGYTERGFSCFLLLGVIHGSCLVSQDHLILDLQGVELSEIER